MIQIKVSINLLNKQFLDRYLNFSKFKRMAVQIILVNYYFLRNLSYLNSHKNYDEELIYQEHKMKTKKMHLLIIINQASFSTNNSSKSTN